MSLAEQKLAKPEVGLGLQKIYLKEVAKMSNQNSNTPHKTFGSVELSTGANIANAVRGEIEQIGIPDSRLPEVDTIFKKALNAQEYAICTRGFGLGCDRMTQAKIADELHLDHNTVSRIARGAITKLTQAPHRGKIMKLVPTLKELLEAYGKYDNLRNLAGGLKDQNHGLRNQIEGLKERCAALQSENSELKDERAVMAKRLEESEGRADKSLKVNSELLDQMEKAVNMAINNFEGNFDILVKEVKAAATQGIKDSFHDTFNEVMGEELSDYLRSIGIESLGTLCKMSRRNLAGLKTPQRKIDEIEERLARVGLSLRAG